MAAPYARIAAEFSTYEPERLQEVRRFFYKLYWVNQADQS
jgi:hypothetical protein